MLLLLAACAALSTADGSTADGSSASETAATPPGAHYVLHGATVVGVGPADVEVDQGRIVAVGTVSADAPLVDVTGRWLAPGLIDSHVHLAYLPEADALAAGGVVAAVDLAAPLSFLAALPSAPHVRASGPMVTAVGGYPTQGWGRGGYGVECADAAEAREAVRSVYAAGARLVKLPITDAPSLPEDALTAAAEEAHSLGLPVVSHALADDEAALAARVGVDVLAHTPLEGLSAATLSAWKGRAVISTLAAFGGSATAVDNLRALRSAGAIVLYGSDFGNTRTPGIDPWEIELLQAAGLSGADILAATTSAPARYWGFDDLGSVEPGKEASLLVLDADPSVDPSTLARPVAVYFQGR